MKQGFDLLRMVSNVIESAEERVTKILRSFKEAIVRDILTRVVPDSFGRIQFRPVRWKLEDFQIATVRFEPGIGFLFFMIRSIILNQIDPVAASVEGGHDHLLQKSQIGLPLKIVFLMQVDETGVVQTDGSENLLRVTLTPSRNLRLASPFGPSGMQRGRLPKRSLVFENDHRTFAFGVFFRFG